MQRVHDIDGSAVARGHGRHAVRGRLDHRQTKRLLERNVHKDTARVRRVQVDVRYVRLSVVLRIGDRTVQIVGVDQLEDLRQDLLAARGHGGDVVPVAHDEHQVRQLPEHGMLAECFDQRRDVLLGVGPRHREDCRLGGVSQEPRDVLPDRRPVGDDLGLSMDLSLHEIRWALDRRHDVVRPRARNVAVAIASALSRRPA